METKQKAHITPGPWQVRSDNPCIIERALDGKDKNGHGSTVAVVYGASSQIADTSRAIAALPELIEALRALVIQHESTVGDDFKPGTIERAEAALRKAGIL